jgi:glyoxylase-like metal-dependent hydrolase (beta-lactamase superfamily II)
MTTHGQKMLLFGLLAVPVCFCSSGVRAADANRLSPHVRLVKGAINGVVIEDGPSRIVVYGDPNETLDTAAAVLFTHGRRDVVWAGRRLVENDALAIVPAGDEEWFTRPEVFWNEFAQKRYHDYAQQTTKIPTRPLRVGRTTRGGESFDLHGVEFEVLDTPGYTRSAVSYLTTVDGVKYAFVGDLIYGDGRLFDLYSVQDAVAEAKIGGYHGWAGRMGELIGSLRRVAEARPDVIVPIRGPVIRNPQQAIERLIGRLQAVYANYLSVSAGRWYFKAGYDTLAERVLGPEAKVDWMTWAAEINERPPAWMVPIHNSRLILSADGRGFLVDCGGEAIIKEVAKRRDEGSLKALDGLFITHYHDDHTHAVNDLLREFNCPVYACEPLVQILKSPWAFRLPAMTERPITAITTMRHGQKMRWKEFTFTFYDFPGQTIYHDAMLVEKDNAEKICLLGDSFTPSGIDDYCLLNRNIFHESTGYFRCLDVLRTLPKGTLLINQHVVETFAFSMDQINAMTYVLMQRLELMKPLFPWPNPNFGIDECWARFYPYGLKASPGQTVEMAINILNHSDAVGAFAVRPNMPDGLQCGIGRVPLHIPPHVEKHVDLRITVAPGTPPGVYVLTADIDFEGRTLKEWCEALIEVQ